MKKILIIRLKPIGDSILISPAVRNLKKLYPDSRIDIIVYPYAYDAVKNNKYLDNIIVLKRKNLSKLIFYFKSMFKRYDIIIDYINNPTSTIIAMLTCAKIRIGNYSRRNFFYNYRFKNEIIEYSGIRNLRLLTPLGLKNLNDFMPKFHINKKDVKTADLLFETIKISKHDKVIGLFISAKYKTRQYPLDSFIKLSKLIAENTDYKVLFLFGLNEIEKLSYTNKRLKNYNNIKYVYPSTTLGELAAIMQKLDLLITNDCGPKHLATAVNVPTLTIFGASDERVWNPPDTRRFPFIKANLECQPCNKLVCDNIKCMLELAPEIIFEKIKDMIR